VEQEPELFTFQLGPFDRHGTTRAPYGNRTIEVEHGIPGETVRAEVFGGKRPRARIREILDPSPDRVEAPCPYFREWSCGGCQWQMISYPGQIERKRAAIEQVMQEAGHDLRVTDIHALAEPWRYRSTAGVALGKRAGFRRQASLAIVPLHECPISHEVIGRLMAALNEQIEAGTIPDYRGRLRVDVRVVEDGALQTYIRPGEEGAAVGDVEPLAAFLSAQPDVISVAAYRPGGIRMVKGEMFASAEVAGRPVWLTAASFFQTNLRLLPELIARLQEEAQPIAGKRIADVYAGVGLFGLFLAADAEEVVVVEPDPVAVQAARLTAERWGLDNVTFLTKPAEEAMVDTNRYDAVILDPPRSGLTPPVLGSLSQSRPPLILYVSCLPQSLARDLGPLTEVGYTVEHLELFDFYPQTYHTEVLAVLRMVERT
jgi:23S rRNA (uracil1939-C5)-methyltransferase